MAKLNHSNYNTFAQFRQMAANPELSTYEKIGFPDKIRKGKAGYIIEDIKRKCSNLTKKHQKILDIGCGYSDLTDGIVNMSKLNESHIYFIDNDLFLQQIPNLESITKIAGEFPDCREFILGNLGKMDCIICYSVIQYVVANKNFIKFIDEALSLLAPGGQLLIGDIPNESKKQRFLLSDKGRAFHKKYMNTTQDPTVLPWQLNKGVIDDSLILAIIHRARQFGFDSYIMPQRNELPMSNRREDILITKN